MIINDYFMRDWLKENLSKLKQALFKTHAVLEHEVSQDSLIEINSVYLEDLEERLIKADIGIDLSEKIVLSLKKEIIDQKLENRDFKNKINETIKNEIKFSPSPLLPFSSSPLLYLICGVNGSGKTTSIGKLAYKFMQEGKKVLIVAADTFRAAAGDQLSIWAEKASVEIFSPPEIKKPDAVVFSAIEKAKKEGHNVILIDTAGRLQTQTNLMHELTKINSVIEKNRNNAIVEKLIILDATIGQNAIIQAELFSKAIGLTGIVLAKLDSSSKGGVILNIMNKLNLPVKFIGTGEKIDDIADFSLDEYLEGLLA